MPDKLRRIVLKQDARLGLDPATIIPESVKAEIVEEHDGVPVANFIQALGGYQGTVTDPFGRQLSVSLEKWRHAPAETRLGLSVTYKARTGARVS